MIKWLVKRFLSEKEKGEISVDKSIRDSKIIDNKKSNQEETSGNNPVVKFRDVGGSVNLNQSNYILLNNHNSPKEAKKKEKESVDKLKTSEKDMNDIIKEKIQKSKLKTEVLEEISKALENKTNKEEE